MHTASLYSKKDFEERAKSEWANAASDGTKATLNAPVDKASLSEFIDYAKSYSRGEFVTKSDVETAIRSFYNNTAVNNAIPSPASVAAAAADIATEKNLAIASSIIEQSVKLRVPKQVRNIQIRIPRFVSMADAFDWAISMLKKIFLRKEWLYGGGALIILKAIATVLNPTGSAADTIVGVLTSLLGPGSSIVNGIIDSNTLVSLTENLIKTGVIVGGSVAAADVVSKKIKYILDYVDGSEIFRRAESKDLLAEAYAIARNKNGVITPEDKKKITTLLKLAGEEAQMFTDKMGTIQQLLEKSKAELYRLEKQGRKAMVLA